MRTKALALRPQPQQLASFFAVYAALTKPGLVLAVVFSAYINYLLSTTGFYPSWRWAFLVLGVYLAGSGAHVLNQLIECEQDRLMARTKNRPLPRGAISFTKALGLGLGLSVAGVVLHWQLVNSLTGNITLATILLYTLVYTPLKRLTSWNTWVGAVPGAMASLTGATAAWNDLRAENFIIPLIIFFWQIPHFLALSWKYREQYSSAGYLMLSSQDKKGNFVALLMLAHTLLLIQLSLLPYLLKQATAFYFWGILIAGGWFLFLTLQFFFNKRTVVAQRVFIYSNIYLLVLFSLFTVDQVLSLI